MPTPRSKGLLSFATLRSTARGIAERLNIAAPNRTLSDDTYRVAHELGTQLTLLYAHRIYWKGIALSGEELRRMDRAIAATEMAIEQLAPIVDAHEDDEVKS